VAVRSSLVIASIFVLKWEAEPSSDMRMGEEKLRDLKAEKMGSRHLEEIENEWTREM
jgi:hypothetical protein